MSLKVALHDREFSMLCLKQRATCCMNYILPKFLPDPSSQTLCAIDCHQACASIMWDGSTPPSSGEQNDVLHCIS